MELRSLGSSGLMVSAIGFGTVKLGRNTGVRYPQSFDLPNDAEIDRLIGAVLDLGINLFDTAPAYGASEDQLGRALQERRNQVLLSSKAGEIYENGVSHFDFSKTAIRVSLERSLQRLKTDWIDLLFLHSDGQDEGEEKFAPAFEELDKLKAQGLIRLSGFSAKTKAGANFALEHVDALMLTLNTQEPENLSVIAAAEKLGRAVLIKKALASGHADNPVAALRFALQPSGVSSAVIGTINPQHLTELATVCD